MPLIDRTFSDIITFTRASAATYFDSAGVLQSAANDAPRFDYDPVTLAARGMLIEEQRTNLLLQSEDLSTTWSLGDGTVTANSWTPPTGVATGDTYTIGTIATTPSQNVTVVSSTTYTLSFYYNKTLTTAAFFRFRFGINGGSVSAWFDTANATFGALNAQLSGGAAVDVGNNIYRVSLQIAYGASDGGSRSVAIAGVTANSGTTADTGNDLAIWGAQLEAGAFPTSYIPTTTAAATRAADVASVNTLAPWFNPTEGTLYAEYQTYSASVTQIAVALMDSVGSSNRATVGQSATAYNGAMVDGGVVQASLTQGTSSTNVVKNAFAFAANDFAFSVNGTTPVTDTSGTVSSAFIEMQLGKRGSVSLLSGYLRRIGYYKRRLSNAQLQAITQ